MTPTQPLSNISMLRFGTAGNVDSGKSTLIGRLLYDTRNVYTDQIDDADRASRRKGLVETDLALLMDGLKAEREQGITIDVANRYFQTPKRKFIIADSPGHEQYTRNMVSGASGCDLMIVLVDVTRGVVTQTRRHTFIASLLQIPHIVVAVNKMDAVGFSQEAFESLVGEFRDFASRLPVHDVTFIPISALRGDNIVQPSANMPWFGGSSLLHHLENVHIASDRNLIDLRFPVQYVLRQDGDFRGYAGTLASGVLRKGDQVQVLPGGRGSRISRIVGFEGDLDRAFAGMACMITLEDELDISRGDMLVRPMNVPDLTNDFEAILVWMDPSPMQLGRKYHIKHTTQLTRCIVQDLRYSIDVNTLHRQQASQLGINEIGRSRIKTLKPLGLDSYRVNRATGSFILIDPISCNTVAGGLVIGPEKQLDAGKLLAMESQALSEFASPDQP